MKSDYLNSIRKQMRYYKHLGEQTFSQLSDSDIHFQPNPTTNNIAIIVKHLHGNMRSRWTNFLTQDGEKSWRDREGEFEHTIATRSELLKVWEEGWSVFLDTLDALTPDDLDRIIYIRNEGHSVAEAINRQLCHYSYHVGQIVFLGVQIKNSDWQSLSIPRGASKAFNDKKFAEEKGRRHFTDGLMEEE